MRPLESRRITGRHLLLDAPGAAIEVALDEGEMWETAFRLWKERVGTMAARIGWPAPRCSARPWDAGTHGASFALTAPPDQLETACLVAEQAMNEATDLDSIAAEQAREASPRLRGLLDDAASRGLPHFVDDEGFTLGYGKAQRTWPLHDLPASLPDVPSQRVLTAFVTGTNGKTTTSRLLARMAREAGFTDGLTSSDAIAVLGRAVVTGDWSGPGAARTLLRHPDVDFAVLETARGGLLRRGLAIGDADLAVVTNVSADHFGEYGIDTLEGMAEAKLSVTAGLRLHGTLVVNARCAPLMQQVDAWMRRRPDLRVQTFADDGSDHLMLGGRSIPWAEIPITVGGLARYNVENALAALTAARALGVPDAAVERALREFTPSVADSAGRTNLFSFRGTTVLIDFAHNPDGIQRLGKLIAGLPASRRWMSLGQAGDRSDALIEQTAFVAAQFSCDRYVVKDLAAYRRGRPPGEVADRLEAGLLRGGVPADRIDRAASDTEAAALALAWVQPGDLVVLLVHEKLDDVLRLFEASA
jgi:cyanophycin synthetase